MHNVNLLLDDHDHHHLGRMATDSGRSEMIGQMIQHASIWRKAVFPNLEIPLVEGPTTKLCVGLDDEEKHTLEEMAAELKWSMIGLVRALIFYYWKLHKSYALSWPKLSYGEDYGSGLSWAPDRAQPWYSYNAEQLDKMEERITADMSVFIRILRENKVREDVVQKILNKFEYAREYREGYYVPGDTPAALQVEVQKSENHRPGYFYVRGRKR